jgi:drug/metabolite transporter (DMT)-like permease
MMRAPITWQGITFGLLTGACWAVSPVFFRWGYAETPLIYVAVLVSLGAASVVSGAVWLATDGKGSRNKLAAGRLPLRPSTFWTLQLLAGVIVGTAIFARWIALVSLSIVAVNSINMLNVPIVVFLAPLLLGHALERTGWRLWLGTACILGGVGLTIVGGF